MKSQLPVGLVLEGNSTASAVLRLPNIVEDLGPIKSGSLRIARRVSNFLRAGYGVATYEELQPGRLVLLRVPDSVLDRVTQELCASDLALSEFAFALCDSWLSSEALKDLQDRGAAVASISALPGTTPKFAVEGHPAATRQVRRLLDRNDAVTLELRPGTKELLFAAELLSAALPIPLFTAAQQALRECGIAGKPLYALLEESAQEMFRTFCAGARSPWGGPLTECAPETAEYYLDAIRRKYPNLAEVLDEQLPAARRMMTRSRRDESPELEDTPDALSSQQSMP
ncbi:MAG: hypothetical protein JOY54_07530 [Acidobacteriaceae bacterium]|nr:hypothetical protein [Acidobacteriaceae bacterium]